MSESVEGLVAYRKENGRVCPVPRMWKRLWQMLPNRTRAGNGWNPAPPLILAAWHDTPAILKRLRVAEHIEWAANNGALEVVAKYLRSLPEDPWFHLGE